MNDKDVFDIDFGRYYDYAELTEHLKGLAEAYPDLTTLHNIGQSYRGRDIWLMEITNQQVGGTPDEKPGYYLDAITHPEEVSGSMVALYTIWYLLTNYGKDDAVTRLLDWQTVYVLPVLNPDGLEICLHDPYYEWHGNARYLPGEEQEGAGLHYADMNDDDIIVDMRIPDENGEWKVSEKDPRLLVQREPYEYGGEYYRRLPEGYIEDFDGVEIPIPRPRDGNLNRNYPYNWGPESEQYGAGEYPLSEPAIEAVVKFILGHPNIAGAINFHTNAGAILLPFNKGAKMPFEDQTVFKRIGKIGADATGYGLIADEKQFNMPNAKPRRGTASGFLYTQLGIICSVVELWDVYKESGIEKDWFYQHRPLTEEQKLKLLKWSDEELEGEGFMDWTPFEHPQLGPVEIGGWKRLFMFRNPPGHRLEEMCHKNAMFVIKHALCAPQLRVSEASLVQLADDVFKVEAVIENQGYLPTNVTKRAVDADVVEPVQAEIELSDGLELVSGRQKVEVGHLAGRAERAMKYSRFIDWHPTGKKVEWVVRLQDGQSSGEVKVRATSQRAGRDVRELVVE